ncbi:hypothetical protein RKE29_04505 [Streptomyces sp. B1866]|uniref:hypothetical protein n=1 Tax=Streptomyces sp. B1866 TaxID=3075431 RepID=UPI0028921B91|nr:hypothetical protein [Streptomyces sp. B1866]MDT3395911.1 hypothetical protein [Streptomyces sp. B1866]
MVNWELRPDFKGTDGEKAGAPFLLPPGATDPKALSVKVGLLYLGGEEYPDYQYDDKSDFAFSLVLDNDSGSFREKVSVKVDIKNGNAWKCGPGARAQLAENFTDLLIWIESECERKGVLVDGATRRVARAVTSTLPLRADEVLRYHYALSTGRREGEAKVYADLLPGMRLRLDTSVSQYLGPARPLNAYVPASRTSVLIGSVPTEDGPRAATFDPFLGAVDTPDVASGDGPARLVGGMVDLHPRGAARSHWRLFYPTTMQNPCQPGSTGLDDNAGIVAADTRKLMKEATEAYPKPAGDGADRPTLYYLVLGRAVPVPEIAVWVSQPNKGLHSYEYVPLGTTVADIVKRFAEVPLASNSNLVSVFRRLPTWDFPQISFSAWYEGTKLPALPAEMYDLPLVAGDQVNISQPG